MGSTSIDIVPSPGVSGQTITIVTAGLIEGHVLELAWDNPHLRPRTVKVGFDGTAKITVPKSAVTLVVTDPESGTEAATTFA